MNIITIILLSGSLIVSSCSQHKVKNSTVAVKLSDTEAQIYMKDKKLNVGDRISAFYNDCSKKMGALDACEKTTLGDGVVTKTLSDDYSVVKFDQGVNFQEGTFVEKL